VVYTSGRTDRVPGVHQQTRSCCSPSVDKFMGRKLRSATLGKLDSYNQQQSMSSSTSSSSDGSSSGGSSSTSPSNSGNKIQDPDDFERGYNARNALDTLRNVSDFPAGVRGRRKALMYFSEGIDYNIFDIFDSHDATQIVESTKDAISAAARANVNFFTIDPRGLVGLPDENIELTAPPQDPSLRLDTQGLMDEVRLSQTVSARSPKRPAASPRSTRTTSARLRSRGPRQQLLLRDRLLPAGHQTGRPLPQDRSPA